MEGEGGGKREWREGMRERERERESWVDLATKSARGLCGTKSGPLLCPCLPTVMCWITGQH